MERERDIRRQAGCAVLVVFDLLAFCLLLYFALGAGMLAPTDCTTEHELVCAAARADAFGGVAITFWTIIAANLGFLAWFILARRSR